jgi:hypothetical protein
VTNSADNDGDQIRDKALKRRKAGKTERLLLDYSFLLY